MRRGLWLLPGPPAGFDSSRPCQTTIDLDDPLTVELAPDVPDIRQGDPGMFLAMQRLAARVRVRIPDAVLIDLEELRRNVEAGIGRNRGEARLSDERVLVAVFAITDDTWDTYEFIQDYARALARYLQADVSDILEAEMVDPAPVAMSRALAASPPSRGHQCSPDSVPTFAANWADCCCPRRCVVRASRANPAAALRRDPRRPST